MLPGTGAVSCRVGLSPTGVREGHARGMRGACEGRHGTGEGLPCNHGGHTVTVVWITPALDWDGSLD